MDGHDDDDDDEDDEEHEWETSENSPIPVDFISEIKGVLPGEHLGMTYAPGRKLHSLAAGYIARDLHTDLLRLKEHYGATTIVTLNEEEELSQMGISDLFEKLQEFKMKSMVFQIKDMNIPLHTESNQFVEFILSIVKRVKEGEKVIVHCKAGKGRTGLVVGCCLVSVGLLPQKAVELVRRTRAGTIQTWAQERYVKKFQDYTLEYLHSLE